MARTAVAYSEWVANSSITDPAGTDINGGTGNGHTIPATPAAGAAGRADSERTVIRVTNTHGSPHEVTVLAAANPVPGTLTEDLTVSVAATTGIRWIGPLQSATYLQPDGTILIDVADAAHTGKITAFKLPRGL